MKTQFKTVAVASIIFVILGFSGFTIAEENKQHKHDKATMPDKSHQEYVDKTAENTKQDVSALESKKAHHKHYKAAMPGESHQVHTDQKKDRKEGVKKLDRSRQAKEHKYHRNTKKNEKHKP